MQTKSFQEVLARFLTIEIADDFDMIVAIAQGGIIPAALLNQRLNLTFNIIHINLRDSNHHAQYDHPQLLQTVDFDFKNKKILLVDDRVKTGSTFSLAKKMLQEAAFIKTFAVNGTADYALYDEACFKFPWIM